MFDFQPVHFSIIIIIIFNLLSLFSSHILNNYIYLIITK